MKKAIVIAVVAVALCAVFAGFAIANQHQAVTAQTAALQVNDPEQDYRDLWEAHKAAVLKLDAIRHYAELTPQEFDDMLNALLNGTPYNRVTATQYQEALSAMQKAKSTLEELDAFPDGETYRIVSQNNRSVTVTRQQPRKGKPYPLWQIKENRYPKKPDAFVFMLTRLEEEIRKLFYPKKDRWVHPKNVH